MLLKFFSSFTSLLFSSLFSYEIAVRLVQNSDNDCFKTASVQLGYFRSKIKIWRKYEICHLGVIFDIEFENYVDFSEK